MLDERRHYRTILAKEQYIVDAARRILADILSGIGFGDSGCTGEGDMSLFADELYPNAGLGLPFALPNFDTGHGDTANKAMWFCARRAQRRMTAGESDLLFSHTKLWSSDFDNFLVAVAPSNSPKEHGTPESEFDLEKLRPAQLRRPKFLQVRRPKTGSVGARGVGLSAMQLGSFGCDAHDIRCDAEAEFSCW
jgi:hypothetical protein